MHPPIVPAAQPLDAGWLFTKDVLKQGMDAGWYRDPADRSTWATVGIPSFWEAFPRADACGEWLWFARTFQSGGTATAWRVTFAAVDGEAEVWVNGTPVGSRPFSTEPFELDISAALRPGRNSLVVLVKPEECGGWIYGPVTLLNAPRGELPLRGTAPSRKAVESADWVRDAVIYCAYVRSSSPEGTFTGLERRIPYLKELGATVLWLLPIHPVGVRKRKGSLGSPYAVRDYRAINPEFGTMADFSRLLDSVHRGGMKMILDLVADHTSWDNPLLAEHPEWYRRDAAGSPVAPVPDWTDVAALDYGNQELRRWMIGMMCWWVREAGIDGFRCDVAELVPTDFWEEARSALDAIKPVMMLSEGSLPAHHVRAFDLSYSWNVYNALDPLLRGKRSATLLDRILRREAMQFPNGSLRMRFVTNHDKNAWDAPAAAKFGPAGLRLAAVLTSTMPGIPMVYTGEEVGNDRSLSLFEKTGVDWRSADEMGLLYRRLFLLRREHPALSRGRLIRPEGTPGRDVYAFLRVAGGDAVVVALNFSEEPRSASLTVPWREGFGDRRSVRLRDAFSGDEMMITPEGHGAIKLDLGPRGYSVLAVER